MTFSWNPLLANTAAFFDDDRPIRFQDAAAESRLLAQGTPLTCPLPDCGVLLVTGADAESFLQGQLTSDVKQLTPMSWQRSAWCSAKGRMLASFIVARLLDDDCAQRYALLFSGSLLASVQKRLQMFILRAKVKLSNPEFAVFGQIHAAPMHVPLQIENDVISLCIDEKRTLRLAPAAVAENAWAATSAESTMVGQEVWRYLDVEAGIVEVTSATQEEFVPQMVDLERIGGLSFKKGCYPGQEIVARTQYLGKVKRHLYRSRSDFPVSPGARLFTAGDAQASGVVATCAMTPDGDHAVLSVVIESAVSDALRIGSETADAVLSNFIRVAA